MKKFSKKWISSKNRKKQHKYRTQADWSKKHRMCKVNLTKELREKHKMRNISLKKGDLVKVMTGKFKKKEGKVAKIDIKNFKVYVEALQVGKKEGTKVNVPFDPSNLQIKELNLEDKKRLKIKEK
jgi:ribosomal protein uL24